MQLLSISPHVYTHFPTGIKKDIGVTVDFTDFSFHCSYNCNYYDFPLLHCSKSVLVKGKQNYIKTTVQKKNERKKGIRYHINSVVFRVVFME